MPHDTATRRRAPVYDVFQQRQLHDPIHETREDDGETTVRLGDPIDAWVQIAEAIDAPDARQAIRTAADQLPEQHRYGTFAAVLTGTFRPRTRRQQVITDDIWE